MCQLTNVEKVIEWKKSFAAVVVKINSGKTHQDTVSSEKARWGAGCLHVLCLITDCWVVTMEKW